MDLFHITETFTFWPKANGAIMIGYCPLAMQPAPGYK